LVKVFLKRKSHHIWLQQLQIRAHSV